MTEAASLLIQAVELHQKGQLAEAETGYRQVLEKDPHQPDAHHNLGILLSRTGRAEEALGHTRRALESRPDQGQYWLTHIEALMLGGFNQESQQWLALGRSRGLAGVGVEELEGRLQQVLTNGGKSRPVVQRVPDRNRQKLLQAFQKGRMAEMKSLARTMVKEYPRAALGWQALGTAARGSGALHEALPAFQTWVLLSPEDPEAHNNLAIVLWELGRLDEAETHCRAALALRPKFGEAFINLGNVLNSRGALEQAEEAYRQGLTCKPGHVDALCNLANVLRAQGKYAEAETLYRRVIAVQPRHREAYNNLGNALRDLGRYDEAEKNYRRALELKPGDPLLHVNLGVALEDLRRNTEAMDCYDKALALNPMQVEALYNKARLLEREKHLKEAEAGYQRVLSLKPDHVETHNNLGNLYKAAWRMKEAEDSYRRALAFCPDQAQASTNLAVLLRDTGSLEEALRHARHAVRLAPDKADHHHNLSLVLKDLGYLTEAMDACKRCLELQPDHAPTQVIQGALFREMGHYVDACDCFTRALGFEPDFLEAASNRLFTMNCMPGQRDDDMREEAKALMQSLRSGAVPFTTWNTVSPSGALRVGLVSGDFRQHPVGYFLNSMLPHMAGTGIELMAYSTLPNMDAFSRRLQPHFSQWSFLHTLSDEEAAKKIHADAPHVLVDLSGHTAYARLGLFAWKPAPIQVSWLGYFATTGLPEIDHILVDPVSVPAGHEGQFVERPWYLPDTRFCFSPPEEAPEVSPLPALTRGRVTYGCFQNLAKVGPDVMALWKQILAGRPDAHLRWQCHQFRDAVVLNEVMQRLEALGIARGQVTLLAATGRREYLQGHEEVDLILDSFPFTGGTTTCEALWMGVPTLTLTGSTLIACQGASIMQAAGLPDWVVNTPVEYVQRARAMVEQPAERDRLARLRAGLRAQVATSPLFDGRRFAHHWVTALRAMWAQFEGVTSSR